MEYVRLQVADGKDMSWFTYDMLPDTLEEEEPKKKRRKKSSDRERTKDAKRQKKEDKKEEEIHLKAYTEACNRGNPGYLPSSVILSSTVDVSSNSTTRGVSSTVPLNPTSTPQITPILNSPITHSSDSDLISQDPSSPSTENLSRMTNPQSNSISEEATYYDPDDFETIGKLVKSLIQQQRTETIPPCSDTPMSESTHVFAPLISEVPVSEPVSISSAPPTKVIPVVYLDISDDEILISDTIPTVTSPSDPTPQTEVVPFKLIPNNPEECIHLFGYDALKRIYELRTSACPHPVLVKRAWEEFRRWLDQSVQNIAQMAESTKQTKVLAAAERRIHYELELAARMSARKKAAEEKASLEAAEKAEFLSKQAEIKQAMLE